MRLDQEDLGAFLYEDLKKLEKLRTEDLTLPLVEDWYETRATEIEAESRLVDNSLELIKLAIERGFEVRHCLQ